MKKLWMVAVAGLAQVACAQDGFVGYRVFEDPDGPLPGAPVLRSQHVVGGLALVPPYSPLQIDLESLFAGPVPANVTVQVYDVNAQGTPGGSAESLGPVTIVGRASSILYLWVADGADAASSNHQLVAETDLLVAPGLRHLGGLELVPPAGAPTDTSLRDNTMLSIVIKGDLAADPLDGNIAAANIGRVEVSRDAVFGGGTIDADLIATRGDGVLFGLNPPPFRAIRVVQAEWQVLGDIVALGEPNQAPVPGSDHTGWGSIGTVRVGPSLSAPGVQGDIIAENGFIEKVLSTGPIGTSPTQRSLVKAGFHVRRISARASEAGNQVLAVPFYADVEAGDLRPGGTALLEISDLNVLETEGDYHGSIRLKEFFGDDTSLANAPTYKATNRRGIFIGGHFYGDIHVDYCYEYGDIIARSFRGNPATGATGSIWIGQMLKGAVVAVGTHLSADPLDGTIGDVSIGLAPVEGYDPPRPFRQRGLDSIQVAGLPAPFEGSDREAWYTASANDFSAVDSVVRAGTSMGDVHIAAMSKALGTAKRGKARLESPTIDSLTIDEFHSGVVWSGRTDNLAPNSMSNDYCAVLGNVAVGCVGPMADLWLSTSPEIAVTGDMFGEIRMPSLDATQTISIGGRLGEFTQFVGQPGPCFDEYPVLGRYDVFEASPRGYWVELEGANNLFGPFSSESGIPTYSSIILEEPTSLNGQIIIDANNTTGAHRADRWTGDVVIGTGTPAAPLDPYVISKNSTRARSPSLPADPDAVAPFYAIPSHLLGGLTASQTGYGGAIGLVPFARYEIDCRPYNAVGLPLGQTDWVDHDVMPFVAFYGPVKAGASPLIDLRRIHPSLVDSAPVSTTLWEAVVPADNARLVRIEPGALGDIPPGRYGVEVLPSVTCDLQPGGPSGVLTYAGSPLLEKYQFVMAYECTTTCDCDLPWCFLADFNFSGSIDGDDVIDFYTAWDANDLAADMNLDFGVDGDDLILFNCWWDSGCSF